VELGDKVRDPITGFKGTAVAFTQWLFGCRRITVQPTGINKDGNMFEVQVFDEPQLRITKRANISEKVTELRAVNGGPRPNTGKRSKIKR
ncbi:hypothetical protein LCGC14_3151530, partial [marine sediment metagenome]